MKNISISPTHTNTKTYRLFCFPYAGGTPTIFADWSSLLQSNIDVYPVDWHVLDTPPTTISNIAKQLVQELPLDKPFIFAGSCLGSLIIYELTKELYNIGKVLPIHIYIMSCAAPHIYTIAIKDTIESGNNARKDWRLKPLNRNITYKEFHDTILDEIDYLGERPLIEMLEYFGFQNLDILRDNKNLFDLFLPRLMTDMKLAMDFLQHEDKIVKLAVPITVYYGGADNTIVDGYMNEWKLYTSKEFKYIHISKGTHYLIHSHKTEILQEISQQLAE